jgi:hypothetical protein
MRVLETYSGELSDDEIIDLIIDACEKKRAEKRLIEYKKELSKPPKAEILTAAQLYKITINKAIAEHEKRDIVFSLNEAEKQIYLLLSMYFAGDSEIEKHGFKLKKGLLIFGPVGCGKTTAMGLFRRNPSKDFGLVSCLKVTEAFKKDGPEGIEKFYSQSYCFDDFGTETSGKYFGNESNVLSDILLTKYESELSSGFKTYITTNLTPEQIEEGYGKRLRSRMKEMFNVIRFPSDSEDKRK